MSPWIFLSHYQAFPFPAILDVYNPSVIRLLNASADQTLQVTEGTVFGSSKSVRLVASGFYYEIGQSAEDMWDRSLVDRGEVAPVASNMDPMEVESNLVGGSEIAPGASIELHAGRLLSVTAVNGGAETALSDQPLPAIIVIPSEPPLDNDLSEAYRRFLAQEPDPFSEQCVYLTDKEILEHLHWDELEALEEWKQKFFELCCAYREIFAS